MAKTPEKNQTDAPPEAAAPKVRMVPSTQPPEEIYVDGVSGILGRSGVIKLDCFRVYGVDRDNTEVRSVTHRLVLPAGAIPGLVRLFQNMANVGQQAAADAATADAEAADAKAEKKS
jgi:hypothetical protein